MTNNTTNLWTRNFILFTLSNTFLFSGFHIFLPTLPLYVLQQGGTSLDVGLLSTVFLFFAISIRFFTNQGVQKWGKKRYLYIGCALCFLSAISYMAATSVPKLLSLRVTHGLGFGIATTLYAAIVAELIPQTRRGEGIGYFGLGTTLAMAIAPGLGVWIVDNFSFNTLFLAATCSQVIALACLSLCSIPEEPAAITTVTAQPSIWDRLIDKALLFQSFLALLFGVCIGGVLNFIALLAKEANITNAGAFFLMCTVCIFLSRLATGRIFDKKGPAWVILPGALLFLIGFVVLAQSKTMTSFLLASALYGFGYGTIFPALQTWMFNLVTPAKRSAASATFYNMIDIGNGIGSVALGLLAGKLGYASIYWCSAGITSIFLLSYAWSILRESVGDEDILDDMEV